MTERRATPLDAIRSAIASRGPISFAEFMELALYGPGGFYDRPPVGERGHFVTSPHVHPVFGALLGDAVRGMWRGLGRPDPLTLVEVGAGDGTLAAQLRRSLADVPKRYVAVERSPGARDALGRLQPQLTVTASIEALDQRFVGVVLANELLDNLPFRWIRKAGVEEVSEALVALEGDGLVSIEGPVDDPDVVEAGLALPDGVRGVYPEGALHFVDRLARVLHRGYALLVDYAAGPEAEVHGYRGHRPVEDVLQSPGTADITAGVDFGGLARRARMLGLQGFEPVTQRSALLALGFEAWAERELRRQAGAQDRRSGREAVSAWSGRNAAALLVDPAGLGRLRWWLVASPGLEAPDWLVDASTRDLRTTEGGDPRDEHRPTSGFLSIEPKRRRRPRRRA